jgi:hypothetical protein
LVLGWKRVDERGGKGGINLLVDKFDFSRCPAAVSNGLVVLEHLADVRI